MTSSTARGIGSLVESGRGPFDTLPIILLAAVIQGWALYGLHIAIKGSHWPATAPGWLLALYALAIVVPLTTQMLVEHARQRPMWIVIAALGVLFAYFGWHHGTDVLDDQTRRFANDDDWFPLALVLTVLWLLMLPFIQARLGEGHWRARYAALFQHAWRNKLTLAEAGLFTVLFWLLLVLWAKLFDMLGIEFFEELFKTPIFFYPVTSLVFGVALHLIGSVERLTSAVLEQLLNVLKWLAIVAGLILALFTLTLIFKLPGMIASGERAISASWLLWLVAVTVLLVNAAYRDGSVEQPYPRPIALALRVIVPLTAVIAGTALYAMYVRVETFGITITRVWAMIVTGAACIYSVGYSIAAWRSHGWMGRIAGINVGVAVFLIVALSLALTPLLSPYRLAANSQFHRALAAAPAIARTPGEDSPLLYLRFSAGRYGLARLDELTTLQDHPRADDIRRDAMAVRQQEHWRSATQLPSILQSHLDNLRLPEGRTLDAALRATLMTDLKASEAVQSKPPVLGGVFVDLNRDGQEEFVLMYGKQIFAYTKVDATNWRRAGIMTSNDITLHGRILERMLAGDLQAREPRWQELQVGQTLLRLHEP